MRFESKYISVKIRSMKLELIKIFRQISDNPTTLPIFTLAYCFGEVDRVRPVYHMNARNLRMEFILENVLVDWKIFRYNQTPNEENLSLIFISCSHLRIVVVVMRHLLLICFNFNPTMDKWSHAQWNAGWNYVFIPKLQRCNRWSLWLDKQFHPTYYNGCNYLSEAVLKSIHVSKMAAGISCLLNESLKVTNGIYLFELKPKSVGNGGKITTYVYHI